MAHLRTHTNFNRDWLFMLDDQPDFCSPELNDSSWRSLRVPHDWSIEYPLDESNRTGGGGGYALAGTGWYRKHFLYDPAMDGKRVSLMLDGIYMDSRIYLNGIQVGANGYGYSSFSVDITGALRPGENVLAVRVDNSRQPNSRWYTGSGIFRNVWLDITEEVHMAQWGVFCVVSNLYNDNKLCSLQITADVVNESDRMVNGGVLHRLYDAQGNQILQTGIALQLEANQRGSTMVRPTFENPHLWTDDDPYLYTLKSTIVADGKPVDEVSMKVGLRTAVFDCDKGFLLNGRPVKINGMCLHHDCGLTGGVGYRETWERRLKALKAMGCNGIRCAHNPPTPELLDLCDELGFLVMDEAFDEWLLAKDKNHNYYSQNFAYGSSEFFSNHAEEIMVMMLHRDRNHPSIVLWSIGNEIGEQAAASGPAIARWLCDICHREDPTRMTTAACDNIVAAPPATTLREYEEALDFVGYNYVNRWRERAETQYDDDRKLFPKRRFIGTENSGAVMERGIYTPRNEARRFREDYRTTTHYHEWLWRYMSSRDFVAGDYIWTGIDHLGETSWPCRGSVRGPLDTAAFPKDTYYYYRSIWKQDELTLHIVPHWNWKGDEGEYKQVIVYTNCDKVDLFINGRKVGTKSCHGPYYGADKFWNDVSPVTPTTHDLHLTFDVAYEPGELKAIGYKGDQVVMEKVVQTTGEPVALHVKADREIMAVDGVAHIEISTVDAQGRHIPTADPMITCEITEGPARLLGMDAGDLYDLTPYTAPSRKMFSGRLLAMIYANEAGKIRVKFSAEGMEPITVDLRSE